MRVLEAQSAAAWQASGTGWLSATIAAASLDTPHAADRLWIKPQQGRKSPTAAGFLSGTCLLLPVCGLGSFYAGNAGHGWRHLGIGVGTWGAMPSPSTVELDHRSTHVVVVAAKEGYNEATCTISRSLETGRLTTTHCNVDLLTGGLVNHVRTRRLCFSAKPLPRCRSFLVTEAHVRYRLSGPEPGVYPTAELGWMVNGRGKHSYGFSVFGGREITWEATRAGLKGRYRRWLGHGMSLDLSAGLVLTSAGDRGLLRADKAGVTVGGGVNFGVLAVTAQFDYIPAEARTWRGGPAIYLGAALGSKPGAVAMAAVALVGAMVAMMPAYNFSPFN